MDKEIVLDNEYVTMWFHQDKKIVHHKYHQFLKGDYIRNQLNELIYSLNIKPKNGFLIIET